MTTPPTIRVPAFRGLDNKADPAQSGPGWLARADDVLITATGAAKRRPGYSVIDREPVEGLFATRDYKRLYVAAGGELRKVADDFSQRVLASGLQRRRMHWCELDGRVYFTNGKDSGVIAENDAVLPWGWPRPASPTLRAGTGTLPAGPYQAACTFVMPDGRETGASEVATIDLGAGAALLVEDIPPAPAGWTTNLYIAPAGSDELGLASAGASGSFIWTWPAEDLGRAPASVHASPLPDDAELVSEWRGRLRVSQHFASHDVSAVWTSVPLAPHLFDQVADFFMVPGRVTMLAPADTALVVGTDRAMFAFDGEKLVVLAEYGAPFGSGWARDDDGTVLLWTHRGMCRAMPFENLTTEHFEPPTGSHVAAAIMQRDGAVHFVAAQRAAGAPFNERGNS